MLIVVATDHSSIITPANTQGAATLVVEVLSDGITKVDEMIKNVRYEHFGIPEYSIVDLGLETVKICRLSD